MIFPTLLKFSEMLSFLSVAEAYGMIYPFPSDDNFSFVVRILLNPQELTILRLSSNKFNTLHFSRVNLKVSCNHTEL